MQVYIDMDPQLNLGTSPADSFKAEFRTKMKYSEFMKRMSETAVGVTMKDEDPNIFSKLRDDI